MADHNVVLVSSRDSNLLHCIDLTDGSYHAVEFNHFEALDDLYYGPGGELLVEFDGDGGMVGIDKGDGQLDVFAPSRPDMYAGGNSAPIMRCPISPGYDFVVDTSEGINIFTSHVEDAQGNTVASFDSNNPNYPQYANRPSINGHVVNTYIGFNTSVWAGNFVGTYFYKAIPHNGFWWDIGLVELAYNGPYEQYLLKMTINAQGAFDIVEAIKIDEAGAGGFWDLQFGDALVVGGDGSLYAANKANDGLYKWLGDANFGPLITNIQPSTVQNMRAVNKVTESSLAGWPSFADALAQGVTFDTVDLSTMSVQSVTVSAPQVSIDGINIDSDYNFAGGVLTLISNTKEINGERVIFRSALVFDSNTNQASFVDFTAASLINTPCPVSDMNTGDALLKARPVYEVTGTVELDGHEAGTEVFMLDNTSMYICGRTIADPVTGAYKFRCLSPGSKSVFARHPVSKGMRLAADVTPVLVP